MPAKDFGLDNREVIIRTLIGSGMVKDPSLPPWKSMTTSELAEVHERLAEEPRVNQQMSGLSAEETLDHISAGQESTVCAMVHEVNDDALSQDPEYVILATNGAIKWKLRRRLSDFCKVALATQVLLSSLKPHRRHRCDTSHFM